MNYCKRCGKPADDPNDLHTCTPAQPVAWQNRDKPEELLDLDQWEDVDPIWHFMYRPLYAAPPARQPLTDEQIQEALSESNVTELPDQLEFVEVEIARAIERAHGIGGDA